MYRIFQLQAGRMLRKQVFRLFVAALLLFGAAGCGEPETPGMKVTFRLINREGFIPSNQIAIWIQKPGGEFFRTLFVCDYLSYGGFAIPDICPEWVSKSNWKAQGREYVDAVSQATPDAGMVNLVFDFQADDLKPGTYEYCVEIHVAEKYNELYRGKLEIDEVTREISIGDPEVTYFPDKYPKGSGMLSELKVEFKNI